MPCRSKAVVSRLCLYDSKRIWLLELRQIGGQIWWGCVFYLAWYATAVSDLLELALLDVWDRGARTSFNSSPSSHFLFFLSLCFPCMRGFLDFFVFSLAAWSVVAYLLSAVLKSRRPSRQRCRDDSGPGILVKVVSKRTGWKNHFYGIHNFYSGDFSSRFGIYVGFV